MFSENNRKEIDNMITFSNGRKIQYFVASGALAFDCKGWFWERLLVLFGFIDIRLFGLRIKSLTLPPRKGYLRWLKVWECFRQIIGGAVNKIGLKNPGHSWWMSEVAPNLDFENLNIIMSLYGNEDEIVTMIRRSNHLNLTAFELNVSCPNTGCAKDATEAIIKTARAAKKESRHPLILKISADQDGVTLARALLGIVEAFDFNTLEWSKVFPGIQSPLHRLEKKVGGGGGGVSGRPLQKHNWPFMKKIHEAVPEMPLIASSIMEYDDLARADSYGASAYSFGTIFLPDYPVWLKPWTIITNPCKATRIARRHMWATYSDLLPLIQE